MCSKKKYEHFKIVLMFCTISSSELHSYLLETKACQKMYVASTWNTAQEVGEKYNIMYTVQKIACSEDHVKRKYIASRCSHLIIDCSEDIADAQKRMLRFYPYHKITLVNR